MGHGPQDVCVGGAPDGPQDVRCAAGRLCALLRGGGHQGQAAPAVTVATVWLQARLRLPEDSLEHAGPEVLVAGNDEDHHQRAVLLRVQAELGQGEHSHGGVCGQCLLRRAASAMLAPHHRRREGRLPGQLHGGGMPEPGPGMAAWTTGSTSTTMPFCARDTAKASAGDAMHDRATATRATGAEAVGLLVVRRPECHQRQLSGRRGVLGTTEGARRGQSGHLDTSGLWGYHQCHWLFRSRYLPVSLPHCPCLPDCLATLPCLLRAYCCALSLNTYVA